MSPILANSYVTSSQPAIARSQKHRLWSRTGCASIETVLNQLPSMATSPLRNRK